MDLSTPRPLAVYAAALFCLTALSACGQGDWDVGNEEDPMSGQVTPVMTSFGGDVGISLVCKPEGLEAWIEHPFTTGGLDHRSTLEYRVDGGAPTGPLVMAVEDQGRSSLVSEGPERDGFVSGLAGGQAVTLRVSVSNGQEFVGDVAVSGLRAVLADTECSQGEP